MAEPSEHDAPQPPAPRTRVAVALHGFLRTGLSMLPVRRHLRAEGWQTVALPTFAYPLAPLEAHAERVADMLRGLSAVHGGVPVDIVTHSMGGLLIRATLRHDVPVRRVVMLAPPNQGAWMAARVRRVLPVHRLGWDPLAPLLPGVPRALPGAEAAEIAVITGGSGDGRGLIPFLPDDNDGRVRVAEARLDGVAAFRVVPYGHALIMARRPVLEFTTRFLREGRMD